MAKKILDFKEGRATGLTGTAAKTFTAFDFSDYGFTSLTKFMVEFNAVAVAAIESASSPIYSNAYSARTTFNYDPGTDTATLVQNHPLFTEPGDVAWLVQATSGTCTLRANTVASLQTWTVGFFARMIAICER